MRIESATSPNNPSFRIYRIVGAGSAVSFVGESAVKAGEELVIFAGDEEPPSHYDTERRLAKLSHVGRMVMTELRHLPLAGIYVAVDQLQLTSRAEEWTDSLHQAVLGAVCTALGRELPHTVIPWGKVLSPPDVKT